MFYALHSAALTGLSAEPVEIEIDINKGQTSFTIVGLPDTIIKESRDRLHAALKNSGFAYPFNYRVIINLAPADTAKEGAWYDLPMAVGLAALNHGFVFDLADAIIVGELSLDGSVRPINGTVPLALFARESGYRRLFVPEQNSAEAGLIEGIKIFPVRSLQELVGHLNNEAAIPAYAPAEALPITPPSYPIDLALIKGQAFAKRALEIAASGHHNLLLSGPPGSGKTLLARALPSILPPLSPAESLEVTKIYSVAGLLEGGLVHTRPFRNPHHTASGAALIGGGRIPHPGEITLAHRGVLFLDEFPELPRSMIESLRQPLEDGVVTIARAAGAAAFPARFLLVASQNPCPCGYHSDPEQACVCSDADIVRYRRKVSGPILDRIDLHIEVPRVPLERLTSPELAESSAEARQRVCAARARQEKRFAGSEITNNSEMGLMEIRSHCALDDASLNTLKQSIKSLGLSARGYNRVLKVARTIADLSGTDRIKLPHIAEALQFRLRAE